eukprot:gene10012-6991_t
MYFCRCLKEKKQPELIVLFSLSLSIPPFLSSNLQKKQQLTFYYLSYCLSLSFFFHTHKKRRNDLSVAPSSSFPFMAQELAPIFARIREQFNDDPCAFHANLRQLLRDRIPARGNRFNLDHHDMCLYIRRSKNLNVVVYQAKYKSERSDNLGEGGEQVESGVRADCVLHPTQPLHPLWIKLEPEHVARRRARGETDDRCEISLVERKMAYGAFCECFFAEVSGTLGDKNIKVKRANAKKLNAEQEQRALAWWKAFQPHYVKFVAVPSCPVLFISLKPVSAADAAAPAPAACSSPTNRSYWFSMEDSVPVLLTAVNGNVCVLDYIYVASTEPKHFYQLPKVDYIDFYGYTVGRESENEEERHGGVLQEERKSN